MNIKFLSGVLLCRKAVSFCHFVNQIPEKVNTGSTAAEQALRQSKMAVPAIISRWWYAFVKLSKDMMVEGGEIFINEMDFYGLLCPSAMSTIRRRLHWIQW